MPSGHCWNRRSNVWTKRDRLGLMPPFVIALSALFVVELAIVCGYTAWLIL
jgi:hypothetical protein